METRAGAAGAADLASLRRPSTLVRPTERVVAQRDLSAPVFDHVTDASELLRLDVRALSDDPTSHAAERRGREALSGVDHSSVPNAAWALRVLGVNQMSPTIWAPPHRHWKLLRPEAWRRSRCSDRRFGRTGMPSAVRNRCAISTAWMRTTASVPGLPSR